METKQRAWIYVRVASAESVPDGLELKKGSLCRLAKIQGFDVVGMTTEVSGGLASARPGIQELYEAAESDMFDVLFVKSYSRLDRGFESTAAITDTLEALALKSTSPIKQNTSHKYNSASRMIFASHSIGENLISHRLFILGYQ